MSAEDTPAPSQTSEQASSEKTVVVRPGETLDTFTGGAESSAPVDDYAICGKIGDGGMGIVYLARDRRLGRYVAIKRLNDKSLADPILRQRFLHEARAVAALNHSHIVHIYALGEDALGPYIVMEYVSGPEPTTVVMRAPEEFTPPAKGLTLEAYIAQHGPQSADDAVAMILKIARTMVYAHSCGVIHRDLKPANILLDPSYEPKLVDFGLARLIPHETQQEPLIEGLTVPGEKLVSLGYSAPELEEDASTSDARADIYSLGAILYFLLTGRNPRYFREQDVPTFLRDVLRRSMETEREQRYRTAQDFVRALSEAASHGKVVAPTIKMTWRCKWCDAVNPTSTKFCAECGWDGCERCLECNAETFIGQQYCPSCGADRRMYEHVASIVSLVQQAWDERRFERLGNIVGRLHGFEPAGPVGRKMITNAQAKVEEAERQIGRRNRLAALIPSELKAQNYERAKTFIEEFRSLNEDPLVYETELRNMPHMIFERDVNRIYQFINRGDWESAQRLSLSLAPEFSNTPDYHDIQTLLQKYQKRHHITLWSVVASIAFILYLATLPPIIKATKGQLPPALYVLYAPATWIYKIPGIHWLGTKYAQGLDIPSLDPLYAKRKVPEVPPNTARLPSDANLAHEEFSQQLRALENDQKNALLIQATQFRHMLNELLTRQQEAGAYDDVVACTKTIQAYNDTQRIPDPVDSDPIELQRLKTHYQRLASEQKLRSAHQIEQLFKRYHAKQDEIRKHYTRQGLMDVAGEISAELERIQKLPIYIAATELLQSKGEDSDVAVPISGFKNPKDFQRFTNIFDALRTGIRNEKTKCNTFIEKTYASYLSELKILREKFRDSGNFDAIIATDSAITRFENTKRLTRQDVAQTPQELRAMQINVLTEVERATEQANASMRMLYATCEHELEEWKRVLTKSDEMEAASAVNDGLRGLRNASEYREAFGLEMPEPPQPTTPKATTPTQKTPVEAPTKPTADPATKSAAPQTPKSAAPQTPKSAVVVPQSAAPAASDTSTVTPLPTP